jgi:hypothetical protein
MSTRATGSPDWVQGASAAEWLSTYEGLMAEHAEQTVKADQNWAAYERQAAEPTERSERAWLAYSVASRRAETCWNEARAAYTAWKSAAGSGQ